MTKLNIVVEPEIPSWKRRRVEAKDREAEESSKTEELKRLCREDYYGNQWLEIREVEGKGYCVFATNPIPLGSPVCEYKGRYITRKMGKLVDEPYVFDFPHKNKAMSIDASEQTGTVGRYISHERAVPNVVCRKKEFVGDDRPHLIFFAIRDIAIGEEIAYEYGDFSQESAKNHPWLG